MQAGGPRGPCPPRQRARIKPSLAPAATPLLSEAKLAELKAAGLQRVAISLDGPDRESHEALRRVPGSFNDSLGAIERCRDAGLGLQINTTVTRHNIGRLSEMADAVEASGAGMWSVFFLVPVGRGLREQRISPEQYEEVFAFLHEQAGHRPFAIKTTEAPFYRRFVLQRKGDPQRGPARAPLGINDGKGVLFIAHDGGVQPSGFLDLRCGPSPATASSRCTASTRRSAPSATPTASRASAARASSDTSAAAPAPGPSPSPATRWPRSPTASTAPTDGTARWESRITKCE